MATPDASLVQQQLADLKESYKHRLAEDLVDLERCTTAMLAEQGNRELMASLCQSLHRIAGSAGTFGWMEVGTACREMEQQTQVWLKRADEVAPEALEMIRARLKALVAHMHQATPEGGVTARIDFDAGSEYTDMGHILHVEDDSDLHQVIAAMCRDIAVLDVAQSLQEARQKLGSTTYDLVLLDLGLPDGSGWELMSVINSLEAAPPVVVLSGNEITAEQRSRVQGALAKSRISNTAFVQTLQQILHGRSIQKGSPQ